jgi:hypothetical protein
MIDNNHWLLLLSDLKIVLLQEVLGNTYLLTIIHIKKGVAWAKIEFYVLNYIGSLIAVIGNHALVSKLISTSILESFHLVFSWFFISAYNFIIKLINPIKYSLS